MVNIIKNIGVYKKKCDTNNVNIKWLTWSNVMLKETIIDRGRDTFKLSQN